MLGAHGAQHAPLGLLAESRARAASREVGFHYFHYLRQRRDGRWRQHQHRRPSARAAAAGRLPIADARAQRGWPIWLHRNDAVFSHAPQATSFFAIADIRLYSPGLKAPTRRYASL